MLVLWPHSMVFVAWLLAHHALGYGAFGSGYYIDPLRQPGSFAWALLERPPVLLLGQWALPPADAYGALVGGAALRYWFASIIAISLLVYVLLPLFRRSAEARFWGFGMVLSLIPVCATGTSNRLLFFVGLGAMGLLAQFLGGLADGTDRTSRSALWNRPARMIGYALVFVHLLVAPLLLPPSTFVSKLAGEPMRAAAASLPNDPRLSEQDLVIVNSPDHLLFVTNVWPLRLLDGRPLPKHLRGLVTTPVPIELWRLDRNTLQIHLEQGLFRGILGTLFRGPDQPMKVGYRVELEGMSVEVVSLNKQGEPSQLRFRFDVPLEDPSLRWVRWEDGVYVPFQPPAMGQRLKLPAPRGPMEMQPAEMLENYRKAARRNPGG